MTAPDGLFRVIGWNRAWMLRRSRVLRHVLCADRGGRARCSGGGHVDAVTGTPRASGDVAVTPDRCIDVYGDQLGRHMNSAFAHPSAARATTIRTSTDAGFRPGSVSARSASGRLRASQQPIGVPIRDVGIQPGKMRPSQIALIAADVSAVIPPIATPASGPPMRLRSSGNGLLRESEDAAKLRIQRCGIGSSCDCSPNGKLAGIEHDLQRAAAAGGTTLPAASRERMESAFPFDFAAVQVHTGPGAHDAASPSYARAHSPRLRAAGDSSGRAHRSLLALLRSFGNQHVQRVLALGERPVEEQRADPAVERSIAASRGGGAALEGSVRAQMESAFGADLSGVRIHTGADADALNTTLNARAFTTGQDIFFRHGAYDPGGTTGRRLLAHELTHVVQRSGSTRGGPLTVGPPGDAYEVEAERVAEEVVNPPAVSGAFGARSTGTGVGPGCRQCEPGLRRQVEDDGEGQHTALEQDVPGLAARWALAGRGAGPVIRRQATIRQGSVGCPTPEAQDTLNATGAALAVDGRFGPLTQGAVRTFQQAHPPLVVDGVVGPHTWAALKAAAPGDHGLPAGEDTAPNGWADGTHLWGHRWRQRLRPFATDFRNCRVTEADPGGGADTCWFAGSAILPLNAVTGGTWDVDATNHWGDDFVGWFNSAVTYYRTQRRAPCGFSLPQSMRVVRPDGDVEYQRNQLGANIGVTTVSSTRDGHTVTKTWP